jgi:hypothetical protein
MLFTLTALADKNKATRHIDEKDLRQLAAPATTGNEVRRILAKVFAPSDTEEWTADGSPSPSVMVLGGMRSLKSLPGGSSACEKDVMAAAVHLRDNGFDDVYCPALRDRGDLRDDSEITADHERRLRKVNLVVGILDHPSNGVSWALGRRPRSAVILVLGRHEDDRPYFIDEEDFAVYSNHDELRAALDIAIARVRQQPGIPAEEAAPLEELQARLRLRLRLAHQEGDVPFGLGLTVEDVEAMLATLDSLRAATVAELDAVMSALGEPRFPESGPAAHDRRDEVPSQLADQAELPLGQFSGSRQQDSEGQSPRGLRLALAGTPYAEGDYLTSDERAAANELKDELSDAELGALLDWANDIRAWELLLTDSRAGGSAGRFRNPMSLETPDDWREARRRMHRADS